jgi:hypothetical protein
LQGISATSREKRRGPRSAGDNRGARNKEEEKKMKTIEEIKIELQALDELASKMNPEGNEQVDIAIDTLKWVLGEKIATSTTWDAERMPQLFEDDCEFE